MNLDGSGWIWMDLDGLARAGAPILTLTGSRTVFLGFERFRCRWFSVSNGSGVGGSRWFSLFRCSAVIVLFEHARALRESADIDNIRQQPKKGMFQVPVRTTNKKQLIRYTGRSPVYFDMLLYCS